MDDLNSRQEINKYRKFKKVDGAAYRKVNQFPAQTNLHYPHASGPLPGSVPISAHREELK